MTKIVFIWLTLKQVWKKDGLFYETASYLVKWEIVDGLETRHTDLVSMYKIFMFYLHKNSDQWYF